MSSLRISRLRSNADTNPLPVDLPWPDGFDAFHETGPSKKDKDASPAWCPALFNGPRKDTNVVSLSALVLDYDAHAGDEDPEDILNQWDGYERVLHSTHTPGRYRLILPYERPVTPAEHAVAYAAAIARHPERVDASCANPSRLFYWPTVRHGEDPIFAHVPGRLYPVPVGVPAPAPVVSPPPVTPASGPYAALDAPPPIEQNTDIALMEERCAFSRHARDDAATLREPEWYAYLSLVARCAGGDTLAHERSAPHPNYSRSETAFKYERAKSVGPATCAHIKSISTACRGCPLVLSTPLQLGRPAPSKDPAPDAPPTTADADPHEAVREAEVRAEAARAAHTNAVVDVETAKRALRVLRGIGTLASEAEITEAVRTVEAARQVEADALSKRKEAERALAKARKAVSVEGLPAGADPAVWQRLTRTADGPKPVLANVLAVLRDDPKWASRLAYDAFACDVMLDGKVVPETHATRIAASLSEQYAMDVSSALVAECVRVVAEDRPCHPVRDYLGGLVWDGVARVRDLMRLGFGAEVTPEDEDLVALIGQKFIVSMVARVLDPGSKVDTMLVLVGKQGAYKSTSFETLAGQPWFSGSKLDLASKDSFLNLRGKWLYELAELESMRRVDASTSKQWLSQRVDTYRAPYERRAADHKRQTIIVGTTNEDEFLMDPTGHRRYWPVRVVRADLTWLRAHRDQLFAEAVALYTSGTTWWFDEDTDEARRLEAWASPHVISHPWTEAVRDWLAQRKSMAPFSAVEALSQAVMRSVGDITHGDKVSMAGVLRRLGCADLGVRGLGPTGGVRMYAPPARLGADVVLREKA